MPVFTKGTFSINLGLVSIGGTFDEEDRQCAWELYCELISRVALVGKENEHGELVFTGERYDQSLDSLHAFFREARALMRRYPVGKIGGGQGDHLGFFIAALLEVVIRPFLEKWQVSYRHWWQQECRRLPQASPFERQRSYPRLEEMLEDWRRVRRFCRDAAKELARQFKLPDAMAIEPPGSKQQWLKEIRTLIGEGDA